VAVVESGSPSDENDVFAVPIAAATALGVAE